MTTIEGTVATEGIKVSAGREGEYLGTARGETRKRGGEGEGNERREGEGEQVTMRAKDEAI